jgi:hypothetical protein
MSVTKPKKSVRFNQNAQNVKKGIGFVRPDFSDVKINIKEYYLNNFNKKVNECYTIEGKPLYIKYDFENLRYRCSTIPATSIDMITFLFMILDIILLKDDDVTFIKDIKYYLKFIDSHFKFHINYMKEQSNIDLDVINFYIEIYKKYQEDITVRKEKLNELEELYKNKSLNSDEIEIIEELESNKQKSLNQSNTRLKQRANFIKNYRDNIAREKAAHNAALLQEKEAKLNNNGSCLGSVFKCFQKNSK